MLIRLVASSFFVATILFSAAVFCQEVSDDGPQPAGQQRSLQGDLSGAVETLIRSGKYDTAREMVDGAFAREEKSAVAGDAAAADMFDRFARLYELLGSQDQAERLYARAVEITKRFQALVAGKPRRG